MHEGQQAVVCSNAPHTHEQVLIQAHLHGQPWGQWMLNQNERKTRKFCVGWGLRSAVPLGPGYVPSENFALLDVKHRDCQLHLTSAMRAVMCVGQARHELTQTNVSLPRGAEAQIACGALTLTVAWQPPAPVVGRRPVWRGWSQAWPALVAIVAMMTFAAALWLVPADSLALSSADNDRVMRLVGTTIIPPATPAVATAKVDAPAAPGAAMGNAPSTPKNDAVPNPSKRVAARSGGDGRPSSRNGILDVLSNLGGHEGSLQSLFANSTSDGLGEALEGLQATSLALAYSTGGLGVSLDSGPGERTLGDGRLATVSGGCAGKDCGAKMAYGHHVGRLGPRRPPTAPTVSVVGCREGLEHCGAHGALDKEIVRREIRRHIKEIKYCYEQQLLRAPSLSGRVAVRFVISPTGTVAVATVAESSLQDARVESCMTTAVKRWQFPVAARAGATIVTYPFAFSPAGG